MFCHYTITSMYIMLMLCIYHTLTHNTCWFEITVATNHMPHARLLWLVGLTSTLVAVVTSLHPVSNPSSAWEPQTPVLSLLGLISVAYPLIAWIAFPFILSIHHKITLVVLGKRQLMSPNKDKTAVCGSHALLGLLTRWRLVTMATKVDVSPTNHKSLVACG